MQAKVKKEKKAVVALKKLQGLKTAKASELSHCCRCGCGRR